ncbi:hypothetical protein SB4_03710 [Sphingomonas sanguinis]|uniref:Uncharacterized protein n=1 Tax=Sphingomonas sanguinis TaxID=33051 RepID=A0A147J1V8_9SPHN|nr:hypothetical protein SB4_03710 [Sphingomonas sanguinis]
MGKAFAVDDAAIVAGGEASEMLEAAKASLDLVAMLLDGDMMEDGNLRRRWDEITAAAFIPAIQSRKSLPSSTLAAGTAPACGPSSRLEAEAMSLACPAVMSSRKGRPNVSADM